MKPTNFLILIVLIILTLVSAESAGFDRVPIFLILVAGLKFILISLFFMGIKDSHWGWKFIIILYILVFMLLFFTF